MRKHESKSRAGIGRRLLLLTASCALVFAIWFGRAKRVPELTPAKGGSPGTMLRTTGALTRTEPNDFSTPSGVRATGSRGAAVRRTTQKQTAALPGQAGKISTNALKQIGALEREKAGRTMAQQKIDSQLLFADKMRLGVPIADGVPTQRVDLDYDEQGRVLVDIKADVTDRLLQSIQNQGGTVINYFPQYHAIRAGVPLASIGDLATNSEIDFVEPAVRSTRNNVDSQGDYTHQANVARTTFGVDGTGVTVGVLSDSVDYLSSSQIAGLVTVLAGQSGVPSTGEGTAMLEIVNDLAPGAQLYFATADGSPANFANNILQLRSAGCDIIVDDVEYSDESPFQDSLIAQAVNTVTASGALFFSAASNSGNKSSGTAGTWEGDFSDGGQTPSGMEQGRIHSFGGATNYDLVLPGGSELRVDLFWSDPLGASTNDYDVFVLDPTGSNVVASSTNPQNGSQDPYESVGTLSNGEYIVIVKSSGTNRFLHLETGRGRLSFSTPGRTKGHSCAINAFGVAAVNVNDAYPSAFAGGAQDPVEVFSSDGPRRVFFQADGTPITPGNFSSSGGAVRQKPDIAAADGVTNDFTPGLLNPFFGTSAAAPHAAAIAALLKSYNPNLTAAQVRTILTNTTLDIMAPGMDRDSGAGIVMALAALQATPLPQPDLTRNTDSLDNSSPHTGDVVTASITVQNQSCSGGGLSAGAFHVGFYWSTSPDFGGVTPFYEQSVVGCAANGTVSLTQGVTISAANAPGTYYLGYRIDDLNEVAECNKNNNGVFYWTVTVLPPPMPDLTRYSDSLNNSYPHTGDVVMASITIQDQSCSGGGLNAGAFHVGFYWSTNSTFNGVAPFYEAPVGGCLANGTVSLSQNVLISAGNAPGTHYLGYKIDDHNEVAECNKSNNGFYFWTVTVLGSASGINTTPGDLIATLSGKVLSLSWPTDHIGWTLQAQTNPVLPETSTNWFALPGSSTTNLVIVPIVSTNKSVVYRLAYP